MVFDLELNEKIKNKIVNLHNYKNLIDYSKNKTVIASNQTKDSKIIELAPYLSTFTGTQKPTFFLCRDYACEQPIKDPKEVGNFLNSLMVKNKKSLD